MRSSKNRDSIQVKPKDFVPKDVKVFKDNVKYCTLDELKTLVDKYGKEKIFEFGTLASVAEASYEMTKYLLSLGADPNQYDDTTPYNWFPLLNAVISENSDIVQVLYDYGADLNMEFRDDSQRRALSWAAGYGDRIRHYFNVLKRLLELGAEVNFHYYPHYDCCSPLGHALENKEFYTKVREPRVVKEYDEIIELLKEYGAEYYYKTYEELNPPKFPPIPKRDRFRGRLKKRGSQPGESGELTVMGLSFVFRWIPPGEFPMGSPETEKRREKDETQHRVKISQGLWMLETPVTQEMYLRVMNEVRGWHHDGAPNEVTDATKDFPVDSICWNEAKEFCRKLIELSNERYNFRLPTEAEWEYACRAGTTTPFYWGKTSDGTLAKVNTGKRSKPPVLDPEVLRPCPVRSYPPNPWNLYDMLGNVNEWVEDYYQYYPEGDEVSVDPIGEASPETEEGARCYRGGGFYCYAGDERCACRGQMLIDEVTDDTGFRIVVSPVEINLDFDAEDAEEA